jgi:hypothetical protein
MKRVGSKSFVFSLVAIVLLTCTALPAQRSRKGRTKEQTWFGPEMRIERPVKLPEDVAEQLLEFKEGADEEPTLKRCLREKGQTAADVSNHFAASEININDDAARDLIVQATSGCFMGAHNTAWWIFSGVEGKFGTRFTPGYDLVFSGRGDDLKVLKAATYGYRDIETTSFAGAGTEFYETVWKFDGREYHARICTIESGGKRVRVKCDW